jgi:hypothetical protein
VALYFATDGSFPRNELLKTPHKWLNSSAIINYHCGKICICENTYRREGARVHKIETDSLEIIGRRCAGQIRTFLDELKNETDNYGSIHSMTRQITYDYHSRFLIELLQNAHDALEKGGKVQVITFIILVNHNIT